MLLIGLNTVQTKHYTWEQTLEVIRQIETGGTRSKGIGIIGDGGKALGPYQIHKAYWIDSNMIRGKYKDCLTDAKYSEQVVYWYGHRYSRQSLLRLIGKRGTIKDVECISRRHNGGPKGDKKKATLKYWDKIKKALK